MNARRLLDVLGLLGLLGLLALVAAGAGCSIERRSDAYVCSGTVDCSDGRICVDQLCVVGPDGGPQDDAGRTCPATCTSCDDKGTCILDCMNQDCERFTCPTGWKCQITCGQRRCKDIDCGTSECDIKCTATGACEDIRCGPRRCNVACEARNSCETVDCSTSCGCTVACNPLFGCLGADLSCPAGCTLGGGLSGCDGTTAACNRCSM